jgi:hypothetical protein
LLPGPATRAVSVQCPGGAYVSGVAAPLNELAAFVRRFVVVTREQADALALWIAHTHAFDAADATPYLAITSAEKRSGKSRLLDVLELLVARAWRAITPTEAVVFRKIEKDGPTLLLDEVDAIFGPRASEHEGLRALLNAGNRRGTTVPRCIGPSHALHDFSVFCAKALAGIGELPDTIADRAIPIRLKRKAHNEAVERFRRREVEPAAEQLRAQLVAWAVANVSELAEAWPALPSQLDDRAGDAWEPLFAIAELVGGDWPKHARAAAVALSAGQEPDDDSIGVRLLADMRRIFDERTEDRISTEELLATLAADDEAPWADWHGHGKALSARSLAHTLKRYGIYSGTVRLHEGKTPKGYKREDFEDAWSRYLPEPDCVSATSATTALLSGKPAGSDPPQASRVVDRREPANAHEQTDVPDVAHEGPNSGETAFLREVDDLIAEGVLMAGEESAK